MNSYKFNDFWSPATISVPNKAEMVNYEDLEEIYTEYKKKYGGEFELTFDEDSCCNDSSTLTLEHILQWNVAFTYLPQGDGPILREVLRRNVHLDNILDKVDEEFKDKMPHPTEHFRVWLKNDFQWPEQCSDVMKNQEFKDLENERKKTMSKEMKAKVHIIPVGDKRVKAFTKLNLKVSAEVCEDVEHRTRYFRDHYGGSRDHPCLYCSLNYPCHGCGKKYPVSKFVEVNDDDSFRTKTKEGLDKAGVWDWRCCGSVTKELGLHLCSACGVSHIVHRKREIKQQRKDIKSSELAEQKLVQTQYHYDQEIVKLDRSNKEDKKKITQLNRSLKKSKENAENKKTRAERPRYQKLAVRGGGFKGNYIQMRILQGGQPAQFQSDDCQDPQIQQFFWVKEDGNDVFVTDREPGKNGQKKSNGCSKVNRKRIHQEKETLKEIEVAFKEMEEEEKQARQEAEQEAYRKRERKDIYVRKEIQKKFQNWIDTKGVNYRTVLTLQEELDSYVRYGETWYSSPSEFERAMTDYRHGPLANFGQSLRTKMRKFDTLEEYIKQTNEDKEDLRLYGRVMRIDKICTSFEREEDKLHKTQEVIKTPEISKLKQTIAEQKRKMAAAREAYNKRQKVV